MFAFEGHEAAICPLCVYRVVGLDAALSSVSLQLLCEQPALCVNGDRVTQRVDGCELCGVKTESQLAVFGVILDLVSLHCRQELRNHACAVDFVSLLPY